MGKKVECEPLHWNADDGVDNMNLSFMYGGSAQLAMPGST